MYSTVLAAVNMYMYSTVQGTVLAAVDMYSIYVTLNNLSIHFLRICAKKHQQHNYWCNNSSYHLVSTFGLTSW